jgi:hypothetical protein
MTEKNQKTLKNDLIVNLPNYPNTTRFYSKFPLEVDDREVSFSVPETYELIIECRSEAQQKEYFEKLNAEGYKLRILTL